VSLPVTRTAAMSLDGSAPKSKFTGRLPKAARKLHFEPLEAVQERAAVDVATRPDSGPDGAFLPSAPALPPVGEARTALPLPR